MQLVLHASTHHLTSSLASPSVPGGTSMATMEDVTSGLDEFNLQGTDNMIAVKENFKNVLQENSSKNPIPQITCKDLQENRFRNSSSKHSLQENTCKNFLMENRTRSTPTSPNCFRQGLQSTAKPRTRESPVIRLALFPRLEKCLSEPEVWNDNDGAKETQEKVQGENTCPGSRSEGHISHMSEAGNAGDKTQGHADHKAQDVSADDIDHSADQRSMLSDTSQPPILGLRPEPPPPPCPDEGLIMPRKLANPCLQSRDHQNLHRELLFNQKIGKNVLNQKSELQRALEKHKESQMKKELEMQKQDLRTPFEKVIEERARRLESMEKSEEEEQTSNKPEFLQVHAKLRARMDSK